MLQLNSKITGLDQGLDQQPRRPPRTWHPVAPTAASPGPANKAATSVSVPQQTERVSIVSYNILADSYAKRHRDFLYPEVPQPHLDWPERRAKIVSELVDLRPDVICLQEVDQYDDLKRELEPLGYKSAFVQRSCGRKDGCATFWHHGRLHATHIRRIKFHKHGLSDNVALMVALQLQSSCRPDADGADAGQDCPEGGRAQQDPALRRRQLRGWTDSMWDEGGAGAGGSTVAAAVAAGQLSWGGGVPPAEGGADDLGLLIANTHIIFNPDQGDVKLGQVRTLVQAAADMAASLSTHNHAHHGSSRPASAGDADADGACGGGCDADEHGGGRAAGGHKRHPLRRELWRRHRVHLAALDGAPPPPPRHAVVMCGDFNSLPGSAVYRYLSNGELDLSTVDRRNVTGANHRAQSHGYKAARHDHNRMHPVNALAALWHHHQRRLQHWHPHQHAVARASGQQDGDASGQAQQQQPQKKEEEEGRDSLRSFWHGLKGAWASPPGLQPAFASASAAAAQLPDSGAGKVLWAGSRPAAGSGAPREAFVAAASGAGTAPARSPAARGAAVLLGRGPAGPGAQGGRGPAGTAGTARAWLDDLRRCLASLAAPAAGGPTPAPARARAAGPAPEERRGAAAASAPTPAAAAAAAAAPAVREGPHQWSADELRRAAGPGLLDQIAAAATEAAGAEWRDGRHPPLQGRHEGKGDGGRRQQGPGTSRGAPVLAASAVDSMSIDLGSCCGAGAGSCDLEAAGGRPPLVMRHPLSLRSSYLDVMGHEPEFTSSHIRFHDTCDFIWYSEQPLGSCHQAPCARGPASEGPEAAAPAAAGAAGAARPRLVAGVPAAGVVSDNRGGSQGAEGRRGPVLRPVAVLGPPDPRLLSTGLPSHHYGSDHVCLMSVFEIMKP